MKALVCKALGGPDALVIEDLPDPVVGPGEAVVRMTLTAFNFFDTLIIAGRYQTKPALPFSPGAEGVGVVEALGAGVENVRVGERVIVHRGYGLARARVAVPAAGLTRVPDAVTDEQAAGLTVTYGTSLHALKDRAKVQPGESLAVLGASGGVGLAAVELGALMGARVIACASAPDKLAAATAHGASETVNYAEENLRDALKRLGGERGIDVVYDPVGGDLAEPALRSLGWLGRYLVVGFAAGEIPRVPFNLMLLKGIDVQGVFWGAFIARDPAAHVANQTQLLAWVAEGRLCAQAHGVYDLEHAAEALHVLARREAKGKVLVRP